MISHVHDAALFGWFSSSKRNLENPLIRALRGGAVEPRVGLVAYPHMGVLDGGLFGGSVLVNGGPDRANLPPYMGFVVDLWPFRCIWAKRCTQKDCYLNIMKITALKE